MKQRMKPWTREEAIAAVLVFKPQAPAGVSQAFEVPAVPESA